MTGTVLLAQSIGGLVRDLLPSWTVPLFLAITRLGNVTVFLVVFALDYWFGDHERGAHAIAIVTAGMAIITVLKYSFAQPRPPASVNVIPIAGYSFPSGHAMGATIAYGTLAYDARVATGRVRYAAAGVLVGLIALSRVALGVHFVRDVVAGVAFGIGFLAVAFAVTRHDPRSGFALAIVVSVLALVVSGVSHDAVMVLGTATGAAVAWESIPEDPTIAERGWQLVLVGVVLPVLAGLGYLSLRGGLPPPAVFVVAAVLGAVLIGAPLLVDVVDDRFDRGSTPAG